jgi:hypothetical protein
MIGKKFKKKKKFGPGILIYAWNPSYQRVWPGQKVGKTPYFNQ